MKPAEKRKEGALKRLEAQLASGVKPLVLANKRTSTTEKTPLTENDVKRINREVENLQKKLKKSSY